MAVPSRVFTLAKVAETLGEDKDWLWDISIELEPEDGRLYLFDTTEDVPPVFTDDGIENLKELISLYRTTPSLLPRPPNEREGNAGS